NGDGFAAAAWATGAVKYRPMLSPGYSKITEQLDPFREPDWVEAVDVADDTIRLRLSDHSVGPSDEGSAPPTFMTLRTRPGAVRISAWVDNLTPRAWSVGFKAA